MSVNRSILWSLVFKDRIRPRGFISFFNPYSLIIIIIIIITTTMLFRGTAESLAILVIMCVVLGLGPFPIHLQASGQIRRLRRVGMIQFQGGK